MPELVRKESNKVSPMREGPSRVALRARPSQDRLIAQGKNLHATHKALGVWQNTIYARILPEDADRIRSGKQTSHYRPGIEPGIPEVNELATWGL